MNDTSCPVCGYSEKQAEILHLVPSKNTVKFPDGTSHELAGWWRRVGATFSDNLILFIPSELIQAFFIAVSGAYIAAVLSIAFQGIYNIQMLRRERAQTLGNRIAHTKVVDAVTGGRITIQQVWRRWGFVAVYSVVALAFGSVGLLMGGLVGLVDVLLPLFDKQKQTLHDKFAGTLVVKAN
jgi:uncharacterized RDD family membrane protein YckC